MVWLHTQQPPILHMGLKTANVLLDRFGTAKVGDVGLAKLKAGTIDTASYMQSSVLRGTPAYMAPEYLQRGQCGSFTDVYVLGVIMCELLTGKAAMDAVAALEEVFEDASTSSAEQAGAALQPLLDPAAGWPIATAVEFAAMAAACLQPPKRRPDLQKSLQPALEKMLETAGPPEASVQQNRAPGQQQVIAEHEALPSAPFDPDCSLMMSVECPICHDTLADPVTTPRGITFCRPCITDWLGSHTTCPSTRQLLSLQQLAPNYALAGLLKKVDRLRLQPQQQPDVAPQEQQQQQPRDRLPHPSFGTAAQTTATTGLAPPPAAAMPLPPAQPDPRWRELLAAAKASPNGAQAWQAFGRCFQGCTAIDLGSIELNDAAWSALAQRAELGPV
uniref:RING-type E3 ubiquitin transferase n=1 Tax=Tetradesmus obliquus TaxID=3088 RepID=A0A383WLA4_TETOB|eukprot:jgi/Sobl393_1/11158/SZX78002.1